MISCKEFALDDVMAVTAIPIENYSDITFANTLSKTIAEDDFDPVLDDSTIVIGTTRAMLDYGDEKTPVGELIPIVLTSGKVKDTENDSVAGRAHNVSIECEVDDRSASVWPLLMQLERIPRHLILTFRGGMRAFVEGSEDTYQCVVERGGKKTSVSFKVNNVMGLQLLTNPDDFTDADALIGFE